MYGVRRGRLLAEPLRWGEGSQHGEAAASNATVALSLCSFGWVALSVMGGRGLGAFHMHNQWARSRRSVVPTLLDLDGLGIFGEG